MKKLKALKKKVKKSSKSVKPEMDKMKVCNENKTVAVEQNNGIVSKPMLPEWTPCKHGLPAYGKQVVVLVRDAQLDDMVQFGTRIRTDATGEIWDLSKCFSNKPNPVVAWMDIPAWHADKFVAF